MGFLQLLPPLLRLWQASKVARLPSPNPLIELDGLAGAAAGGKPHTVHTTYSCIVSAA